MNASQTRRKFAFFPTSLPLKNLLALMPNSRIEDAQIAGAGIIKMTNVGSNL